MYDVYKSQRGKQVNGIIGTAAMPKTSAECRKLRNAALKDQVPIFTPKISLNLTAGRLIGPNARRATVP